MILKAGPGDYAVGAASIFVTKAISIHGEFGQPRAKVTGNYVFAPLYPTVAGVSISHLAIDNPAGPAVEFGQGATVSDVVATSSYNTAACHWTTDGTLLNSTCRGTGATGSGAGSNSGNPVHAQMRNVTAVGPDAGVDFYGDFGASSANLTNVIAHKTGSAAGSYDAKVGTSASYTFALTFDHSNYATTFHSGPATVTPEGTGTNQTAPPVFVNAAMGDFHETAASPTVDAGIDDPLNGTVDIDGDARVQGFRTDIGADELPNVVPTAVGDSLTVAQDSAATPVDVLANDTDPDGGPKGVASATQPAHGSSTFTPSGVTYAPAAGFCGSDTFGYSLNGGSTATVAVTVSCKQTPPGDTTPPNTKRGKGPKGKTRSRRVKASFSSTEPGSTFECKLDRAPYKACTSPFKRRVSLGRHVLRVRATDAAGNTDPTPLKFRWTPVVPKPQGTRVG